MWKHKEFLIISFLLLALIVNVSEVKSELLPAFHVLPTKVEIYAPAIDKMFQINVSITNAVNIQGYEFKLLWNTTLLDLLRVEIMPFLNQPTTILRNETNETLGQYWISIVSTSEPTSGNGTLVTFTFKVAHEPTWPQNDTCPLTLADTKLTDSKGNSIIHNSYNGEYLCYASPPLIIHLFSTQLQYYLGDEIELYGNITYGYNVVTNGLIAIEIDRPDGTLLTMRIVNTGSNPVKISPIKITNFFTCDANGNPKSSFKRGTLAYFQANVTNEDSEFHDLFFTITIYDKNAAVLATISFNGPIGPGTSIIFMSFGIPYNANVGTAVAYADALTDKPKNGGVPYSHEVNATFQIESSTITNIATTSSQNGNFNLKFKLLPEEDTGNYTVFSSISYANKTAIQQNLFQIVIPDPNNDGKIDIFDLVIVAAAYGSSPGDPNWDQRADLTNDGTIDIFDLVIIASHYGETTS